MNPMDMKSQGLEKLDLVDLISHFEGKERIAKGILVLPYSIPNR